MCFFVIFFIMFTSNTLCKFFDLSHVPNLNISPLIMLTFLTFIYLLNFLTITSTCLALLCLRFFLKHNKAKHLDVIVEKVKIIRGEILRLCVLGSCFNTFSVAEKRSKREWESDKLLIVLRGRFLVLGGTGCPRYDRFIRDLWWFGW